MRGTKPKAFVFVLMPFDENFQDVYDLGIKSACENAGAYCERVDEQIFMENILERIYNQIAKADIIVAEMTGRNENVFYEVGYAHALNKRVILLTQNADDIPFDLKQFPHIVYGGKIAKLKSQLENKIQWCIENPADSLSRVDTNLQFFINDMLLDGKPELFFDDFHLPVGNLRIVIHNLTKRVIEPQDFNFALIVPEIVKLDCKNIFSVTDLPDKRRFYNMGITDTLFPGGWQSVIATFSIINVRSSSGLSSFLLDIILRVLTLLGSTDYPFTLKLNNVLIVPPDFKLDLQETPASKTIRKTTRKK